MTKNNLAYLVCRVMALYCIFHGLGRIEYAVAGLSYLGLRETPDIFLPLAWCLCFLLTLSFGIALWFFSHSVAERIFPSSDDTNIGGDLNPETLRVIAFSVIGVFLIVDAVPQAVQIITNWVQISSDLPSEWNESIRASTIAQMCKLAVMLGFGVWLTFGAKGIAAVIDRLRRLGTEHEDADAKQDLESD